MAKTLIIAEKPSVAADISRALGKFTKTKDYFENDDYVVTSALGHLLELCLPNELDKKRGKWSFDNLPIIPGEFQLKPIAKTESRLKLLKKLLKRKDIDLVINACDAGREGELIFRYIMQDANSTLPSKRLWLQSMTPEAIRNGFQKLRDDKELHPLAAAAVCRSESDWLVGINSTRAMTAFNSKLGGFQLTPVGRVQTPTLAILVEREEKIRDFHPSPFYEIIADFEVSSGQYPGKWFNENFQKSEDPNNKPDRIWSLEQAEAIRSKCQGKSGTVTEEKKATTEAPKLLFDLTTLQREANSRYGFSARRTLQIAQQLYERFKVLTYPRTDSKFLPEDNLSVARQVLGQLDNPEHAPHAKKALQNNWVKLSPRIFNNAKVTDHHAIIPTGKAPGKLDEAQWKIYDLVTKRFIAAFFPSARYEQTTRITRVEDEPFKTTGKIILEPGWLVVFGRQSTSPDDADANLVPIIPNETAQTIHLELKHNQTTPPARFNEASLLSAMESAGKLVEDESLREAMSEKGLGTPATRAAIIEGLLSDNYVARQGRDLLATAKGISLITLLRSIGIDTLTKPELTGEWEHKLKSMEQGNLQRDSFMEEIRHLTAEIVNKTKSFEGPIEGNYATLEVACPKCQTLPVKEDYRTYKCTNPECDFFIWKGLAGRQFTPEEATTLLSQREIGPLEGFRSRLGRAFSGKVVLNEELKPAFDFEQDQHKNSEPIDTSTLPRLGAAPHDPERSVYETDTAYISVEKDGTPDGKFRMSKTILQRKIPSEQATKLLETGKTDLLSGFISKKGRPFSAFLVLDGSNVKFEFESRGKDKETKTAAKSKTKAKPKKASSAKSST